MSSASALFSVFGAIVAAVGTGVLAARAVRTPRGDLIAWTVGMLGLAVSLGAQAAGHAAGFSPLLFRAMELGAQVVGPLALALGLSELAGRSVGGRFAGRLGISAIAVVGLVIFASDPLSGSAFTRKWPDPAVHYQLIPKYLVIVLAFIAAVVALVVLVLVVTRSRHEDAWAAVFPAAGTIVLATLLLSLPGLNREVTKYMGIALPLTTVFGPLCVIAAALTWFGGVAASRVSLPWLRGGLSGAPPRPARGESARGVHAGDGDFRTGYGPAAARTMALTGPRSEPVGWSGADDDADPYSDADWYDDADEGYEAGQHGGDEGHGGRQYGGADAYQDADPYGGRYSGEGYPGEAFEPHTGDVYDSPGAADAAASRGDDRTGDRGWAPEPDGSFAPLANGRDAEPVRADLYGQITIFTLVEDRIDDFDRLVERLVERVRGNEPATLVYIVHAVPSAPMQRILYEVYRDREAFDRHRRQPYVAQFDADRRAHVLATNVVELGLQQAKVSPFPSVSDLFGEPGYDTSGFERPDYLRDYGTAGGSTPHR